MRELPELNVVGIMTGNSLDAVDLVLTRISNSGEMRDLAKHTLSIPSSVRDSIIIIKQEIAKCGGNVKLALTQLNSPLLRSKLEDLNSCKFNDSSFDEVLSRYHHIVITALKEFRERTSNIHGNFDLIGFHGQTCGHRPPSQIASQAEAIPAYTIQIGDPRVLAEALNCAVISDFRSDDLINGGEGAPLAPIHHQHLGDKLKTTGYFPIAFCNAGNTSNLTIISADTDTGTHTVLGWDAAPFNHISDSLVRLERGMECDFDGAIGKSGNINLDLLKVLFNSAALTSNGSNFITQTPPKSSDPQWYQIVDEVSGKAPVLGKILAFEDRLRTAQYFAAYCVFFNLTFVPQNILMPRHFALCGGGWNNPNMSQPFSELVLGASNLPVLAEHQESFKEIQRRIREDSCSKSCKEISVGPSANYSFDGSAMEARIFADAAICRLKGEPFSLPETTGARSPTIAGAITLPKNSTEYITPALKQWFDVLKPLSFGGSFPKDHDYRFSRATLL